MTSSVYTAAKHGRTGTTASSNPENAHNRIDRIVFAHLTENGLTPAAPADDAVFLRRIYLDALGCLPTAEEAKQFLANTAPNRRADLIDQLLERHEFALYRAMKWSDVLCIKAEFPINLWPVAAQEYYRWLLDALVNNKPYDRFALELLIASGSNFRSGPANFYRAVQSRTPEALAQAVARIFMGMRFEKWPPSQHNQMAVFFSQIGYKATEEWKEEIVYYDPAKPLPVRTATLPDGSKVQLTAGDDPRQAFAHWLIDRKNPYFARSLVNRIWAWTYGRGIIEEPDDIRPNNPPLYADLLHYLEAELVQSNFDQKHIYRLIFNSAVYQEGAVPTVASTAARRHFTAYPVRRLEAEVLIDAICQITGTNEQYSSAVPEPYTIMPGDTRAQDLPDGSISSSFLEAFGRSPRNTGLAAERNSRPSPSQRLHMLNSTHIERKIEQGPALNAIYKTPNPQQATEALYLTILSRYPSKDEQNIAATYIHDNGGNRRQALIDLAWALINSTEFLFQH